MDMSTTISVAADDFARAIDAERFRRERSGNVQLRERHTISHKAVKWPASRGREPPDDVAENIDAERER